MTRGPAPRGLSRRRVLIGLAGAALPAVLSACGEEPGDQPQAGSARLVLSTDWAVGPRGAMLAGAVDGFRAARPDLTIDIKLGNPSSLRSALALTGQSAPDLTIGAPAKLRLFVNAVQLADVTAQLRARAPDLADIYFEVPGNATVARRRYGAPFALNQGAWVYDVGALEAAGVGLPLKGLGVAAFTDAARRLTDPERMTFGTWVGADPRSWGTLVASGADDATSLLTADETDSILHTDARRADYERVLRLVRQDHVSPAPAQLAVIGATSGIPGIGVRQQAAVAFARRAIAMLPLTGGFAGPASALVGQRFAWDFMLGPRHDATERRWTWIDNASHWVTGRAEQRGTADAAVDLALHLAGPAMGTQMAESREFTPDHQATARGERYLRAPPQSMAVTLANTDTGGTLGYGPVTWEEWVQALTRTVAQHLNGDTPIDQAFAEMQATGRAALAGRPT